MPLHKSDFQRQHPEKKCIKGNIQGDTFFPFLSFPVGGRSYKHYDGCSPDQNTYDANQANTLSGASFADDLKAAVTRKKIWVFWGI